MDTGFCIGAILCPGYQVCIRSTPAAEPWRAQASREERHRHPFWSSEIHGQSSARNQRRAQEARTAVALLSQAAALRETAGLTWGWSSAAAADDPFGPRQP